MINALCFGLDGSKPFHFLRFDFPIYADYFVFSHNFFFFMPLCFMPFTNTTHTHKPPPPPPSTGTFLSIYIPTMALPAGGSLAQQYKERMSTTPSSQSQLQAPSQQQRPPTAGSTASTATHNQQQLLASRRLQSLLSEVDPSYTLDEEAAEVVLHLVEEFMSSVATHAAQVARHRGAQAIEHRDVAFTLLKQWNMAVPAVVPSTPGQGAGEGGSGGGGGGGGGGKKGVKRKGGR